MVVPGGRGVWRDLVRVDMHFLLNWTRCCLGHGLRVLENGRFGRKDERMGSLYRILLAFTGLSVFTDVVLSGLFFAASRRLLSQLGSTLAGQK